MTWGSLVACSEPLSFLPVQYVRQVRAEFRYRQSGLWKLGLFIWQSLTHSIMEHWSCVPTEIEAVGASLVKTVLRMRERLLCICHCTERSWWSMCCLSLFQFQSMGRQMPLPVTTWKWPWLLALRFWERKCESVLIQDSVIILAYRNRKGCRSSLFGVTKHETQGRTSLVLPEYPDQEHDKCLEVSSYCKLLNWNLVMVQMPFSRPMFFLFFALFFPVIFDMHCSMRPFIYRFCIITSKRSCWESQWILVWSEFMKMLWQSGDPL